ncbi:MAG TPA: L-threonylcarbamoyladenylate synthase [Rhodoferax sp.]|nr:L-threonylcarbamoyladenylate synthase [Rhodoferax sp.]
MILPGDAPESIAAAVECIRSSGLLGLPTETVYGLAANADDDRAVAQIFKAKGRPADHPLIVHVADASAVVHYASVVPEFAEQLMKAFWPGPLTLILPRRPGVANASAGGNPTIGLRCPSHPVAKAVLNALMHHAVWGLAAPSANQFGRVSPTTAAHVQGEFGDDLLILDGGACNVGIESTIIDCTRGAPVLLRPGAIMPDQVQAICGLQVRSKDELESMASPAPKASGTLDSHYAPHATVRLMTAKELQKALTLLGSDAGQPDGRPSIALYCRTPLATVSRHVFVRRMPADATRAAQQLFAVLRECDAQGVKLIWIETPPETPEWDGVRDRLQRAAG